VNLEVVQEMVEVMTAVMVEVMTAVMVAVVESEAERVDLEEDNNLRGMTSQKFHY
tara:strand:+ start:286 stop:450 length:165 start_codon:yes stop_codon:yes gene_type:complete